MELSDQDYERLLEFRTVLRHFLRWSDAQAEARLVRRVRDRDDGRYVRLQLTAARRVLARLAAGHLEEVGRLAPRIRGLYDALAAPV